MSVVEQWGRPAASSSYLSIARRHDEFVDILAGMPELWQRLLVDHVPHPGGKRCRACTVPPCPAPDLPEHRGRAPSATRPKRHEPGVVRPARSGGDATTRS